MLSKNSLSLLLSKNKRLKILNKKGNLVYFAPNEVQKIVLREIFAFWEQDKPAKIIAIKGRQQGITTLCQLIALSLIMKIPGFQAYVMAHDRSLANDIFEKKIKLAFDNLPEKFKNIYSPTRNNVRQILLDGEMQKSSVTVGLSGRGGTYRFAHISEPGKMSQNKDLWLELMNGTLPAVEFADLIIFESTADGGLGPFYEFVQENLKENAEYKVLFLSWTLSEEYRLIPPQSDEWKQEYRNLARNYKLQLNPELPDDKWFWYYQKARLLREEVKVQYPLNLDEAFISLADNYFVYENLQKAIAIARTIPYQEFRGFKVWKNPVQGHVYGVAVDVATGESNDNTSISVIDCNTGEIVATSAGKYRERDAAHMTVDIALIFNEGYICVEINSFGRAVMQNILDLNYNIDKIYKRDKTDVTKQQDTYAPSFGWLTNAVTRPVLLAEFRAQFEDDVIKIYDEETLQEMASFVNVNGKYQARLGCKDDRVISAAICYQVIKYVIAHDY